MKSAFLSIVSVALFVAGGVAQIMINTPSNAVVCQPLALSWSGGTAPYFLSVLPGADPTGAALEDLGQQNGQSFTWAKVNFAQGTSLGLTLRDANGVTGQSAPFTVNPGADTSCLTGGSSSGAPSSSGGSSAPASSSSASNSTPSSSSPASSRPSSSAPVSSGANSSSRPSATSPPSSTQSGGAQSGAGSNTSSSPGAAPTLAAQYGAAGVFAAVVAAVLA